MATTTTNYGFDIPQSTDLVKDGATAIATLGQDIDTAMNTALGTKKAGMVLLNTTSFSAVSSQSVNDVFSTTYNSYRVIVKVPSHSTTGSLTYRFRVSGADDSNSAYKQGGYVVGLESAVGSFQSNSTTTSFLMSDYISGSYPTFVVMDIHQPFSAAPKNVLTFATFNDGVYKGLTRNAMFVNSTSFTGFSLLASAGNVTGSVSTYGYNVQEINNGN